MSSTKRVCVIILVTAFSILNIHSVPTKSISINLYRVEKAESLEQITNLESKLLRAANTKVNLYKMTEDLAIIFLNTPNPFIDLSTIPYKMLFGNHADKMVTIGQVGGFLPNSEVATIMGWIKMNKMDSFKGFSDRYKNLSAEAKEALKEIGSPDKKELYEDYVKPLVAFYDEAAKKNNSIVFVGQ